MATGDHLRHRSRRYDLYRPRKSLRRLAEAGKTCSGCQQTNFDTDTLSCLHKYKKGKKNLQNSSPCSFRISLARSLASWDTFVSIGSREVSCAETNDHGGAEPVTYCVNSLCNQRGPAWCVDRGGRQEEDARGVFPPLRPPPRGLHEHVSSLSPKY